MGTTEIDLTKYVKYEDIVDNLLSTETLKPLSANQGRILKNLDDEKAKSVNGILAVDNNVTIHGDDILFADGGTDTVASKIVANTNDINIRVKIEDIVDNLADVSTDKPLSAKQGKVLNDKISSNLQDIYDMIYPVGSTFISPTKPTTPSGITCTWEADTSYNGRAIWIDSTQTGGTQLVGSLPDIEGSAYTNETSLGIFVVANAGASGAISVTRKSLPLGVQAQSSIGDRVAQMDFKASNSNSVYSASAGTNVVRPTSVTMTVWKRTA